MAGGEKMGKGLSRADRATGAKEEFGNRRAGLQNALDRVWQKQCLKGWRTQAGNL